MNTRKSSALLAAAALLAASAGQADFQTALKDYNAGRYEAAHGEFLTLAELGDCSSQFNLGAMALKGQGGAAGYRQRRRLAAGGRRQRLPAAGGQPAHTSCREAEPR
jgi:hypothetical protein